MKSLFIITSLIFTQINSQSTEATTSLMRETTLASNILLCDFNQRYQQCKAPATCHIGVASINSDDLTIDKPDNYTSVEVLLLHKNRNVHHMPEDIAKSLPFLKSIVFDGLALTKVTKRDLKRLDKLQFLFLDSNLITHIDSDAFDDLKSLLLLDLDYNKLTALHPDIFGRLEQLETLSVHDNYLATLDEKIFSNNPKLKSIKLHNNEIDELSPQLFSHNQPTDVTLRKNRCIDKEYMGGSFAASFAIDAEKFCKPGRWKIVEFIKAHSIAIISVFFVVILLFIAYIVAMLRKRVEIDQIESRMYQLAKAEVGRVDSEHIYDEVNIHQLGSRYGRPPSFIDLNSAVEL